MVSVCWFRLTVHTSPAENKKPGMSTRQGHKNIKSILKFKCGIKKKASSITTKVSFSSSDDEVHTTYSNEEYNRRNFDFYDAIRRRDCVDEKWQCIIMRVYAKTL